MVWSGMKKYIKNIFLLNKCFYGLYMRLQLYRNKLYFERKTSKIKSSEIITQSKILSIVTHEKSKKDSDVCHIIGSGWSLHESISSISEKDFVVGFNYAGLIGIPFDIYFVEFGGSAVKNISYQHLSIVKDYVLKHTNLIFFKNLWEDKNDMEFVNDHWLSVSTPIKDRIYPVLDEKYLEFVINTMLSEKSDFLPQVISSVVTSIILAYKAGFNKIVIHGVDFGGQYFYEVDGFQIDDNYISIDTPEGGFYGKTVKGVAHPTATANVGMKEVLPVLRQCLENRGVGLFSATSKSPASEFLPLLSI